MPNFDQYLNDYMNIKRLRGVTPGRGTAQQVFTPYFNRQYDIEQTGRKQVFAEQELATRTGQQAQALAWNKEKTMAELAGAKDITLNTLAAQKDITTEGLTWDKEKFAETLALEKELQTGKLGWEREKSALELALEAELRTGALGWDREKTIQALDYERWKRGLLMGQAASNDTKATIGNVIGTVGALGNMYATKQYMGRY